MGIVLEFEKAEPEAGARERWRQWVSAVGARCRAQVPHAGRRYLLGDRCAAALLDVGGSPVLVPSQSQIG